MSGIKGKQRKNKKDGVHCQVLKLYLLRSNALTVPSSDALTMTCPFWLNSTPVMPPECSLNVTKQKPDIVFHTLTYTQ